MKLIKEFLKSFPFEIGMTTIIGFALYENGYVGIFNYAMILTLAFLTIFMAIEVAPEYIETVNRKSK